MSQEREHHSRCSGDAGANVPECSAGLQYKDSAQLVSMKVGDLEADLFEQRVQISQVGEWSWTDESTKALSHHLLQADLK